MLLTKFYFLLYDMNQLDIQKFIFCIKTDFLDSVMFKNVLFLNFDFNIFCTYTHIILSNRITSSSTKKERCLCKK
jgi:hypothetical protein